MSVRLGGALAEHLRRHLRPGVRNFVLVEGVPASVAEGMSRAWADDSLPTLAIVAAQPSRFGRHAMRDASGTQLRNRADTRGVVLVLCDGQQVPDRQSLNLFESVSPSVLLESAEGLGLLSQQHPAVDLDGPARSVREAIVQASVAARPSAAVVAAYLDRLAAGDEPLGALPTLGAFTDQAPAGAQSDTARVGDNLALAAKRTSEELLRPAAYADLRRRTERVLRRRPGLGTDAQVFAAADDVMAKLQSGSPELLDALRFDEAREIMEQRPEGLSVAVRRELTQYQAGLVPGSQAEGLPWHVYEKRADELRRGDGQRPAAAELLGLDEAQERAIFSKETRTKLERLLRDKSVNGSNPSCPEAAIVRAAQQLGGFIQRVQVLSPAPPSANSQSATNRSGAGNILTLACARLRLGGLMNFWAYGGGEVDGLLLRAADDEDLGDVLAAFGDAGLAAGNKLPPLQLRLHSDDRSTVQVDWRPDLDDAASLRAALLFAEAPALSLTLDGEPTLSSFCGPAAVAAVPVNPDLMQLARALQTTAQASIERGLEPKVLQEWTNTWTSTCAELEAAGDARSAEALALSGGVIGSGGCAALTAFAPMKAEWLAQYLDALRNLVIRAEEPHSAAEPTAAAATAAAIARTTASHHPAHLRLRSEDRPLMPSSEGRVWSLFGGESTRDESGFAGEALRSVVAQLLTLQPEAAGHLRCLAWGPGAADLMVGEAVKLIGTRAGRVIISKVEIFCVATKASDKPSWTTLAWADEELRGERDVLDLRYIEGLDEARRILAPTAESPAVHLALVTGLSAGGRRLIIESPEVDPPGRDDEVLFAPRVWQRPKQDRRTLLMPPTATPAGQMWLRLQNAVDESWPEAGQQLKVPEVRTGVKGIRVPLRQIHDLALWVATLDRYATRDSLEEALGRDNVAILHQERRLGGDSPLSLVLSQKSGGPADRAIGRSLRAAGIVTESDVALSIGTQLRRVASQGYGILALQAATSGAGINELVGHVVAFSLLATTATPWPLPEGCRVLLISLDEYRHWFPGKRADLLAIALDPREGGVHVAVIEVKARRSDDSDAASGALDQLNQTIAATKWAVHPEAGNIHSRLWLNRIAEAAYAVARESRFKLDAEEIASLEAFRSGPGSLEWAGVGLVFGPKIEAWKTTRRNPVGRDLVPVDLHGITLTEQLLRQATNTDLTKLRTVHTDRPPLQSSNGVKRGNESKSKLPEGAEDVAPRDVIGPGDPGGPPLPSAVTETHEFTPIETPPPSNPTDPDSAYDGSTNHDQAPVTSEFQAPILGWDAATGEEVRWHAAGSGPDVLQNGHVEVWGSSGMGKTQFTMSLLGQLAWHSGSRFGIADFKNDYSPDKGFPGFAGAEFIDLWNGGAPYNPLALPEGSSGRAIDAAVIELRDTVEEAASTFTRMGVRQKRKLQDALYEAYALGQEEGRWPTLLTLNDRLDSDLAGVMGDLTRHKLFKAGPPLGDAIDRNVVFGLYKIPGNGQTTILAAGFILSALWLRVQDLPPTHNTIRYVAVVDEAHRVTAFKAVKAMIREGRSKGLAVVLATQQPLDLPGIVAAVAQTKICFGLPDATIAAMAARKLEPDNPRLPEQIRTLDVGEAYVSLRGQAPRLLRMTQAHRDAEQFGLPPLMPATS